MGKTTAKTETPEAMSVFVAPSQPQVIVIRGPWSEVTITKDVEAERIEIPIVFDPASRAEAERMLDRLEGLRALVADDEQALDLEEMIDSLYDDLAWYDSGMEYDE